MDLLPNSLTLRRQGVMERKVPLPLEERLLQEHSGWGNWIPAYRERRILPVLKLWNNSNAYAPWAF